MKNRHKNKHKVLIIGFIVLSLIILTKNAIIIKSQNIPTKQENTNWIIITDFVPNNPIIDIIKSNADIYNDIKVELDIRLKPSFSSE